MVKALGRSAPGVVLVLLLVLATASLTTGCAGAPAAPASTDSTTTGVDNPTVVVPTPPTTAQPGGTVRVLARVLVPRTGAVDALVRFVRAHAESVNARQPTALLVASSTPAELTRQRSVIAFAVSKGYAVPLAPRLEVVSVLRRTTTISQLGVCLWLPSTEYREADSGRPPNGPVPPAWAPAVATLRLADMTWLVDTLSEPDNETTISCGSTP